VARIAIDIDSTLHPYWDQLEEIAERRFGVKLPYEEQRTWGITELAEDDLQAAVKETHEDHNILAAEPYAGAVDTITQWSSKGHWIHITSHRATTCHGATEQWLAKIGLPYDDLYCSFDKITRCVELDIDVLVDDSPVNLLRAADEGILGATLIHPWNEELIDGRKIVGARDWAGLREILAEELD
jgi:uncharacterized HAD superfamily protein